MLDLRRRGCDVRAFVARLERWIIATLDRFNVRGEFARAASASGCAGGRKGRRRRGQDRRHRHPRAPLGELPRRQPERRTDLGHFAGIVPCGITGHGVTSLADLGLPVGMAEVDMALRAAFEAEFGATRRVVEPRAAAAV